MQLVSVRGICREACSPTLACGRMQRRRCLFGLVPGWVTFGEEPLVASTRTTMGMARCLALVAGGGPALLYVVVLRACKKSLLLHRAICWRNLVSWAVAFARMNSKWRGQGRLRSPVNAGRGRCASCTSHRMQLVAHSLARSLTHSRDYEALALVTCVNVCLLADGCEQDRAEHVTGRYCTQCPAGSH